MYASTFGLMNEKICFTRIANGSPWGKGESKSTRRSRITRQKTMEFMNLKSTIFVSTEYRWKKKTAKLSSIIHFGKQAAYWGGNKIHRKMPNHLKLDDKNGISNSLSLSHTHSERLFVCACACPANIIKSYNIPTSSIYFCCCHIDLFYGREASAKSFGIDRKSEKT